MNILQKIALPSLLAISLAACQSTGNGKALADKAQAMATLQIGKTSSADVAQAFGDASVYRYANGYERWTYQKTTGLPKFVSVLPGVGMVAPAISDRTTELALLFDDAGILKNIDWHG